MTHFIKIFYFISFIFYFSYSNFSFANEILDEELIDNLWTVRVETKDKVDTSKWEVHLSVNGQITHGDRLIIRIQAKDSETCNIGNTYTTFYTITDNKNILNLKRKVFPAKFLDQNIYIEMLFAFEFLTGYRAYFDLGWNNLDNIKNFFRNHEQVNLLLLDSNDINISEYFDINENIFSLKGLNQAIDKAKDECIKIVNRS